MYPTWYEVEHRNDIKSNRSFELVHNFYTDYNFYLSRIRQGLEGNLTVHEKYTSESHKGSFIHIMYLAMGWVGRFVRVPWDRTGDIYHMARIILAMTLLLITAEIAKRSFSSWWWKIIAFLFAVTASSWPIFVTMDDGAFRFGGYMPWWSVMDSLQRITFIPHLLAGQALLAFILFEASNMKVMMRHGNWIFLGVMAFILGIIFPPGLIFIVAGMGAMIVVEFFYDFRKISKKNILSWLFTHIVGRMMIGIIASPSLIYLQLMTSFFPWKQLALADIQRPLPFKYIEYLQAMGPILPVGLIGLVLAMFKKSREMLMTVAWVLAWIICLIVFNFIPAQSPLRFSEMIPHVPLGILSAYLFYVLYKQITKDTSVLLYIKSHSKIGIKFLYQTGIILKPKILPYSQVKHNILATVLLIIPVGYICLNIAYMHSSWLWQRDFVDHKMTAEYPLVPTGSYVMYPLTDFLSAIRFIQDHTSRDTIILSDTTAGNYIPVYSGNYVYVGHDNTVNSDEKKMFVSAFYNGKMPIEQALDWLNRENLHYVFFGPQEHEDGGIFDLSATYSFLEPIYQGDYVTVYHVKQ
jgi:hypothetical protein